MTNFVAYLCNDPSLSHIFWQTIELRAESADRPRSVAWLQNKKSLRRVISKPAPTDPDLHAMLSDLPAARCVLGAATVVGDPDAIGAHRFREWLFAYNGEFPELPDTRKNLMDRVPEFLSTSTPSVGPGAQVFQLFLHQLHKRNALEEMPSLEQLASISGNVASLVQLEAAVADYTAVAVAHNVITGATFEEPLYLLQKSGLVESTPAAFAGHNPKPIAHTNFRATVLTNIAPNNGDGWESVEPNTQFAFGSKHERVVRKFEPLTRDIKL